MLPNLLYPYFDNKLSEDYYDNENHESGPIHVNCLHVKWESRRLPPAHVG